MLKQTVLRFKGALGYLGLRTEEEREGSSNSNSSSAQSSEDDESPSKQFYTSTGVLTPEGQAISEITATRLTMKDIITEIDAYKKAAKNQRKFFSLFDTKQIVTKLEISSKLKSKIPENEVRSLAIDAYALVSGRKDAEKSKINQHMWKDEAVSG